MRLRPDQTFEAFVPSPTSAVAFGLATALAGAQSDAPRLLLLCGPPGVGKTHLLRAIVARAFRQSRSGLIIQMTAADLIQRLLAGLAEGSSRFPLPPADLLVVDDLHVLSDKARTQVEVGRLFQTLVDRGGRVACASGGAVARIQVLAEAVERLKGGKVIEIGPPTPQEMRRILLRHTTALGLRLRAPTTTVLADQARGDVRRAIGAVTRLQFEQSLRA